MEIQVHPYATNMRVAKSRFGHPQASTRLRRYPRYQPKLGTRSRTLGLNDVPKIHTLQSNVNNQHSRDTRNQLTARIIGLIVVNHSRV